MSQDPGIAPVTESASTLTLMLRAHRSAQQAGRDGSDADLLAQVYSELRQLAARLLQHERVTLSPTALVHELYLRIARDTGLQAEDSRTFFAIAAHRMRQVLVDIARRRDSDKRGGEWGRVSLVQAESISQELDIDTLALDQALTLLGEIDPRKVKVVELRYFAGLDMQEIATILGISRATAQRDWEVARAFLFDVLKH